MAKVKTSISLDEQLLSDLGKQAKSDGVSRSELIERICRRSLNDNEPKVDVFSMWGMPTQFPAALSAVQWHDNDGPVELVIRVPASKWEAWLCRHSEAQTSGGK